MKNNITHQNKTHRRPLLLAVAAGLASLFIPDSAHAGIIYQFTQYSDSSERISGTITTDGTQNFLSAANILGWSLNVANLITLSSTTYTGTGADGNWGTLLHATPTLFEIFSGRGNGEVKLNNTLLGSGFALDETVHAISGSTRQFDIITPIGTIDGGTHRNVFSPQFADSGVFVADPTPVPEPATAAFGVLCVGAVLTRRRRGARVA